MNALLAVNDLVMAFGGLTALDGVSLAVERAGIVAIIGPNGAGKTTLFNVISGIYPPNSGGVTLAGEEVTGLLPHHLARRGLSRTFQNLQTFLSMTVLENVMVGRHLHENRNVFAHLFALPSVIRQNGITCRRAQGLLAVVGLASFAEWPASALPYGALRRLEIARALATEPKVLLLDEPAAGCNPIETDEIGAVIRTLAGDGMAVVLVEHNMRLVMKLAHRIHVLDRGRTLVEGSAEAVRTNPAVIGAYLGIGTKRGSPCFGLKA
jgi:branched-chain amino acid transport system ATP-binding protein